jgi:hypothetical protein
MIGSILILFASILVSVYSDLFCSELSLSLSLSLSLMLRLTFSRPVCLGIKHPSGAYDQIFISQTVAGLLMWGALSDERMSLSFVHAAGPRQHSLSRVGVLWDS